MTAFTATERRGSLLNAASHGGAYGVKALVSTVEVTVATSTGDTINFGYIPSNARICGTSRLYWDDMATTGSPTMDLGIAAVNGNLAQADDPDALSAGHDVATATPTGAGAVSPIENFGLEAWDYVASETADPGGVLKVYGTMLDAVTTQTGTATLELYYVVD